MVGRICIGRVGKCCKPVETLHCNVSTTQRLYNATSLQRNVFTTQRLYNTTSLHNHIFGRCTFLDVAVQRLYQKKIKCTKYSAYDITDQALRKA